MLRNAYLVRASTAVVVLAACGNLVMPDIRAEAATGTKSSEAQDGNVLVRAWQALFRSSESLFPPENQADAQQGGASSKEKTDDNPAVTGQDISSNEDGKGDLFRSDPQYETSYNAQGQVDVYGAKTAVEPPRPLLELGRQQYTSGAYDASSTLLG